MDQNLSAVATQQESNNTSLSVSATQQRSIDTILSVAAVQQRTIDEILTIIATQQRSIDAILTAAAAAQQQGTDASSSTVAQQESINACLSVARGGDVDELYSLIQSDPHVLERFDKIPFGETPLHAAVSEGHTKFALEIMRLKPSFARKLNKEGRTVMQLALERNHLEVILRLLRVDKGLLRVQGKEGLTPLHYVADTTDHYLSAAFLSIYPESIIDLTIQNESALHIALKHDNLDAFRFLFTWLKWASFEDASWWEEKLLNMKDEDGNTLLHIAASKNLFEIVGLLLDGRVDKDAENEEGDTAFDILNKSTSNRGDNINDLLDRAKPQKKTPDSRPSKHIKFPFTREQRFWICLWRALSELTNENRNILLIVVTLLLTVTFQTTVTPPGGTWQEDYYSTAANSSNSTGKLLHAAGTAIMNQYSFIFAAALNTFSLLFMSFILMILLPPIGVSRFVFQLVLLGLWTTFFATVVVTFPRPKQQEIGTIFVFVLPFIMFLFIFSLKISKGRQKKFDEKLLAKKEQLEEQRQGPNP